MAITDLPTEPKRRLLNWGGSPFTTTVHVMAVIACLIGWGLAWMAYDSDHPMKERHYLFPIVLPLLVYGVALVMWVRMRVGAYLMKKLSGASSNGRDEHGF
jgi:ABC-type sulfate transport system permease component